MNKFNENKTTFFPGGYQGAPNGAATAVQDRGSGSTVTLFDGSCAPRTVRLDDFGKDTVFFGRAPQNDIVLASPLVSSEHGRFVRRNGMWVIEDKAIYGGKASTNGLIHNDAAIVARVINDGDFIRIDDGVETVSQGVLFVFSASHTANTWSSCDISALNEVTIGRDAGCTVTLPHVSISKYHAKIVREQDGFYLTDSGSTNGVIVNNRRVLGRTKLHEKDVIVITNAKLIFTSAAIFYCTYKNGISVDASDIVIKRGSGAKSFITCNHVDLSIKPGDLVAIIGGSGAGKSTVLNAMCGYLPPNNGNVYINGVNLYNNFDSLKKMVGYVPQQDIVYDNLTLHDMLLYTAQLRLPEDTSKQEMEAAIARAIATVELTEKRDSLIRSLSGGQKKRASIAVELLSDPKLIFLDEPASGLDPGTERNLMHSLRSMADNGKTVILVTHSTLQLKMCDKIVFMGKGGNLCFYGSHDEALRFFGVDDIVDIYNMITDNAPFWSDRYKKSKEQPGAVRELPARSGKTTKNRLKQFLVLASRYAKLILNDKMRLLLLLGQAPLITMLISIVANGNQFEKQEITKSLFFALACAAFWVGTFNSLQEICKERNILRREYMTGLSLTSYIGSKTLVIGIICFIQSLLILGVFVALVGSPDEGVMMAAFPELLVTTFLTAISAAATGLFVSALFKNADRVMSIVVILLLPQILFSGIVFSLPEGFAEALSAIVVCRWSMEGFGTTANLNSLTTALEEAMQEVNPLFEVDASDFYTYSVEHLLQSWGILLVYTAVCLVLARIVLGKIGKEKS